MNELFVIENIEGLDVLGARCLILNIFFRRHIGVAH